MASNEYIRDIDVPIFQMAAKHFELFILVRKTNSASFPYIKIPGFTPKRLDCKAKTAGFNAVHPKYGEKNTAGWVLPAGTPERQFHPV